MRRWMVMAALLLATCAALPARANDSADCSNARVLTKSDPDKVVAACRRLANLGKAFAQYNLGLMYENGNGVSQNYAEAVKWYRAAAEQGYAQSQNNLGRMYHDGHGVEQDDAQAMKWYRAAADQGDPYAQGNLGYLYEQGKGARKDYAAAMKLYRESADWGIAWSQRHLAYMYAYGEGAPQDYVQALMWFDLAAAQLDADATKGRDDIVAKMTPEQIEKGRALAAVWKPAAVQ